jgi:hypothetical protein
MDLEIGQYHKKHTILSPENGLVAYLTHKEGAYMKKVDNYECTYQNLSLVELRLELFLNII